nr:MAG TPA: GIY-YIG nuclease superfamily protein [Caudoviricetes sp.]
MKQIGIIYKFTIIAKYKFNGHKPFYVGQHFGIEGFDTYPGSGVIWTDFITRLKSDFPTCWRKLIKREVLYQRPCSQKCLDKMEEYFIKKEKSHYSYKLGGCNILWGTANNFGSGSPMKDPLVRERCGESVKLFNKNNPEKRRLMELNRLKALNNTEYKDRISKTLKGRYLGEKNPNFGNKWTEDQKKLQSDKMKGRYIGANNPNFGNKWTEEQRRRMSERIKNETKNIDYVNPMFGKVRITNDIINTVINRGDVLPPGFRYGMKRRN